jgi:hypothetical protein
MGQDAAAPSTTSSGSTGEASGREWPSGPIAKCFGALPAHTPDPMQAGDTVILHIGQILPGHGQSLEAPQGHTLLEPQLRIRHRDV